MGRLSGHVTAPMYMQSAAQKDLHQGLHPPAEPRDGSWQGTKVPAGARSAARSWERHPVPRTSTTGLFPAPFPVHFRIPWEGASGDTGGLQGLAPQQAWVHLFQPSPLPGSVHHLSGSSVVHPAPALAGRGSQTSLPPTTASSSHRAGHRVGGQPMGLGLGHHQHVSGPVRRRQESCSAKHCMDPVEHSLMDSK